MVTARSYSYNKTMKLIDTSEIPYDATCRYFRLPFSFAWDECKSKTEYKHRLINIFLLTLKT